MSPQASIRLGSRLRVLAALVILVGGLGTIVAARQQTTPFEQILAQLATLQASVDALAPGAEFAVAFTPGVHFESGYAGCGAVNVTASPHRVEMRIINGLTGAEVAHSSPTSETIEPGHFSGLATDDVEASPVYCMFTVLDGTKSDIRANISLKPTLGGQPVLALNAE